MSYLSAARLRVCAFALVAFALGCLGPLAFAQATGQTPPGQKSTSQPLVTSQVTVVDVPVLALDKQQQPILGLEAEDFHIWDDGIRQKISHFDAEARPLSLAIVVDISDADAVAQVHRSAEVISGMVVGALGSASVFVGGPEPKQILPFTSDATKLTDTLHRLQLTGPVSGLAESVNQALLLVQKQPRDRTRAVLIISRNSPKSGTAAQAMVESSMNDAVPIFHLIPNRPKDVNNENPISTRNEGTGPGSQTGPPMEPPVDSHGQPEPTPGTVGNVNLGPVIKGVTDTTGAILRGHEMDYIYDSGGEQYSASNDNEFDQRLNLIGDELRSIYHIYYQPSDLASQPPLHQITVNVIERTDVDKLAYRRSYLGYKPQ